MMNDANVTKDLKLESIHPLHMVLGFNDRKDLCHGRRTIEARSIRHINAGKKPSWS